MPTAEDLIAKGPSNATPAKKRRRGGHGRPRVDDKLVPYGLHLRPDARTHLREVAFFSGLKVREVVEADVERRYATLRRDARFVAWLEAGRPLPARDWVAAGMPAEWAGKKLAEPVGNGERAVE